MVTCQSGQSKSLNPNPKPNLACLRNYPVHLSTSHYNCPDFDRPDFVRTPLRTAIGLYGYFTLLYFDRKKYRFFCINESN